jgi:hypothetical protein
MESAKSLGSVGKPKQKVLHFGITKKNWNWTLLTKSNYHPTLAITRVGNENLAS